MKGKSVGGFLLILFVLSACGPQAETTTSDSDTQETAINSESETTTFDTQEGATNSEAEVLAEGVEVTLQDELDGILNSYCLDIAGGNKDVNPDNGLQTHLLFLSG